MAKTLLSLSSLSFSYGSEKVLDGTSLEIKEGDFLALVGPNGAGKTTLAKLILGFLPKQSGEITYHLGKKSIGYVPQRYSIERNFPGTVRELLWHADPHLYKRTGVAELLDKKFVDLSGGQQQRVLIALALLRSPRLLILDEPTTGVDRSAQKAFYDMLKQLNKEGIAILLITHELEILPKLVKGVVCITCKQCAICNPKELPKMLKEMYGDHQIHVHHGGHNHD